MKAAAGLTCRGCDSHFFRHFPFTTGSLCSLPTLYGRTKGPRDYPRAVRPEVGENGAARRTGGRLNLPMSSRSNRRSLFCLLVAICLLLLNAVGGLAANWIRPGVSTNQAVWGISGGLLWAVPPAGFRGGEPRGLIRLGYPILADNAYDLINFIAIEPVVGPDRGFSELERSQLDGTQGKRIWAEPSGTASTNSFAPAQLRRRMEAVLFIGIQSRGIGYV